MKIPECLQLTDSQLQKLKRFENYVNEITPLPDDFDNCCCASAYTFEIYATGVGDVIHCSGRGHSCDLSIGDDGELFPDEFELKGE